MYECILHKKTHLNEYNLNVTESIKLKICCVLLECIIFELKVLLVCLEFFEILGANEDTKIVD